jgi:hypothetical protein
VILVTHISLANTQAHTLRSFPVTPMLPESGDLGTRDAGAVAGFNYHQGGMK